MQGMTNQETSQVEIAHLLSLLGDQYEYLPKIAEETFRTLGKEQAGHFNSLANDWIEILIAIRDTYSKDELSASLLYIYFYGLFKEVQWFQLLFLAGNYPLLHRSLRFVWEMIFRAYHADTPEPGLTIDGKVNWLVQHEQEMFQWKFMKRILLQLLPQAKGTEIEEYYKSLWDKLNKYVHPSKALLDRMVVGAPGFLMTDSFDKEWALETIETATMVFDLVWLAAISRFPRCVELLVQKGLLVEYPIVTTVLSAEQSEDDGGRRAHPTATHNEVRQ